MLSARVHRRTKIVFIVLIVLLFIVVMPLLIVIRKSLRFLNKIICT